MLFCLYPWELPSMPMSVWYNKHRHCPLLSSKTEAFVLRTKLFHVLTCVDTVCTAKQSPLANLMKRCFYAERVFADSEAVQYKRFLLTDTWIPWVRYECVPSKWRAPQPWKNRFSSVGNLRPPLNWEVIEIFNWCQQRPSQVPTDIRRTNAVNEMCFL